MRDIQRIDRIINLLRKRWKENPEQRLSQLIVNYAYKTGWISYDSPDIFYLEDSDLEELLMEELIDE